MKMKFERGHKALVLIGALFLLALLIVNSISFVSAQQEASYCCERTVDGAKCQNAPEEECDDEYRKAPTSCEATSYCRSGCCFDVDEGVCMPNTPQLTCQAGGGVWDADPECNVPQCELGCCLLSGQAAFVTQARCKRLSAIYGLQTNFRADISSETACILSTTSEVEGACVFEKEFQTTCLRLTQKECNEMAIDDDSVSFYPGMLCSAEELATNCGKSQKTTCVEGKDGVYYLDTCGNIANIYDFNRYDDPVYWRDILSSRDSCDLNSDINNDASRCGNCDYLGGSVCKEYENSMGQNMNPDQGDFVCADLGCVYDVDGDGDMDDVMHGETWCDITRKGNPGSRYFRLLCYDGEVLVEPCADYRQEICVQTNFDIGGGDVYRAASCRANRWEDCLTQDEGDECRDDSVRDCTWIKNPGALKKEDTAIVKGADGICIPKYSPGFDFWNSDSDADDICSLINRKCVITYERGFEKDLGGISTGLKGKEDWKAVDNSRCEDKNAWGGELSDICTQVGDCGISENYLGKNGEYSLSDLYKLTGRLDEEEVEDYE